MMQDKYLFDGINSTTKKTTALNWSHVALC